MLITDAVFTNTCSIELLMVGRIVLQHSAAAEIEVKHQYKTKLLTGCSEGVKTSSL